MQLIHNKLFISFYTLTLCLSLFVACTKPSNPDTPTDPNDSAVQYTPVIEDEKLATTVYAKIATVPYENVDMTLGTTYYFIQPVNENYFQAGSFFKYKTRVSVRYKSRGKEYSASRYLPVSHAWVNYTDILGLEGQYAYSTVTGNGTAYFPLSNGGKVTYTQNTPRDGEAGLSYTWADQTTPDFTLSHPTTTVDYDQQRWHFKPFALLYLWLNYTLKNKALDVEIPIPVAYQAAAPDSIEAWYDGDKDWTKGAVAKREGNVYKCRLPDQGAWIFGQREKGLYKTFQVRTADGIPVINAVVRIKDEAVEIGEARSDAEGDAVFFVPANKNLTVTIPRALNSTQIQTFSAGPFNFATKDDPFVLKFPANYTYLRSIKGTTLSCSGQPVLNGLITVSNPRRNIIFCHIPVHYGQYSGAFLTNVVSNSNYFLIKAADNNSTEAGDDTTLIWQEGKHFNVNLKTCKGPTNLFMKYTVDGQSVSVTGDASTPDNPPLTVDGTQYSTSKSIFSGGNGTDLIQFMLSNASIEDGFNPLTFSEVWVKGVRIDTAIGSFNYTRQDMNIGGYAEGNFSFSYYTGATKHEVKGSFRLYVAS